MTQRSDNDVSAPTPEQLAAFVDGELDSSARARVQTWLNGHPEAEADLNAQRRLDRLYHTTPPPEPSSAAWNQLLQRIDREVAKTRVAQQPVLRRSRRWLPMLPLAGAAAVVAAAVLVWTVTTHQNGGQMVVADEPFVVTTTDDVNIISLEDADHYALLVGKSPLSEPIVLVAPGEAREIRMEPDVDGMVPSVARVPDGLATTMIVAPLSWGSDDKE